MDEKYVTAYAVDIDGDRVMTVEVQRPPWLPQKPTINHRWLKTALPRAIQSYLRRKPVVKT